MPANGGTSDYTWFVNGRYTYNGGSQPPSYIESGKIRFNMMDSFKGLTTLPSYADCILMDTYTGSDVPYVSGFGIIKASGNPRAFIAVGQKGNSSTWASQAELITSANIGSQSVNYASSAGAVAWGNVTGKPSSFTPASHTHSYLPLSGGTLTGYLFFSQSSRKCDIGFSGGGDNAFVFVNQQNSSGGGFLFRSYDGIGVQSKDGSSWKSVTAASFNNASSIRFKDNVQDITEERAKELLKYRVVTYDYKNKDNGTNCMGLIAEEVAEIESYPVQMKDNEIFGLDYSRFVPQLIKMVQMQQEEIEELKEKIS